MHCRGELRHVGGIPGSVGRRKADGSNGAANRPIYQHTVVSGGRGICPIANGSTRQLAEFTAPTHYHRSSHCPLCFSPPHVVGGTRAAAPAKGRACGLSRTEPWWLI